MDGLDILDIHSSNEGVAVTNIQICITIVNGINYMAELLNTYIEVLGTWYDIKI